MAKVKGLWHSRWTKWIVATRKTTVCNSIKRSSRFYQHFGIPRELDFRSHHVKEPADTGRKRGEELFP